MKVLPLSTNLNFDGKVIVNSKISSNQNYLFNIHKKNLENMIKDMPFDLFVEQSKSGKTISLSTNVENAGAYIVKKNKQNFEEAASFAISDAKSKSKLYQDMVKAQKLLDVGKDAFVNMILGNFKQARELEKEHAKLAIKDFDVYKQIPRLVLTGAPREITNLARKNGLKYRIYKLFTSKTPEEKQFLKMRKEYLKQLKAENKQIKTVTLQIPHFYY